jgi:hypothetical protein
MSLRADRQTLQLGRHPAGRFRPAHDMCRCPAICSIFETSSPKVCTLGHRSERSSLHLLKRVYTTNFGQDSNLGRNRSGITSHASSLSPNNTADGFLRSSSMSTAESQSSRERKSPACSSNSMDDIGQIFRLRGTDRSQHTFTRVGGSRTQELKPPN